jgi:hypothetical protein
MNRRCAMYLKEMQPEVNLCAEDMQRNVRIITLMNQNQITFCVKTSKLRGSWRT